jgi:DNA-binding PadR family transcriptional regulator
VIRQLLLLGILMDGKMHGYRLNEYIKHTMGFYTDLKKSTAYYILDQMEKEGYVSCETEREGKRPERRVYGITEPGKAYFHELLRDCLAGYTPTSYGDDICVAFIDKLPPAETHALLEGKRRKIVARLEIFKEHKEHGGGWQYVISHNMAHLKADLTWVDSILKEGGKEGK